MSKHSMQDHEIRDFEKDLQSLRDQSKKVESDLLHKLQEMSDRIKVILAEKDTLSSKVTELQT